MNVTVTITLEDYKNFEKCIRNYLRTGDCNKAKTFKSEYLSMIPAAVFGVILLFAFSIYIHDLDAISFLFGIMFFSFFTLYYARRIQMKVVPRPESSILGVHEFSFTELGFSDKSVNHETQMKWAIVESFQESSMYFFILLDSFRGYIIPKRDLKSEEIQNQLRQLIKSKIT